MDTDGGENIMFIKQVEEQLNKMLESDKDQRILSQARLL